ncbi:hypothetical protein V1523DRAFT_433187 [Lipomyces doorenjongii]
MSSNISPQDSTTTGPFGFFLPLVSSSNTNVGPLVQSQRDLAGVVSPSPTSSAYTTPPQLSDSPEDDDDDDDDTAADIDDDFSDKDGINELGFSDDDDERSSQAMKRLRMYATNLPTELVLAVFSHLDSAEDVRSALLVCNAWARCAVELLWYRPNLNTTPVLLRFLKTLKKPDDSSTFPYGQFVRRLNLTAVSDHTSDQMMTSIADACCELERLTLASCRRLTDASLVSAVSNNPSLIAIDLSHVELLTDDTVKAIASSCHKLQGLNLTGCKLITDHSVVQVAQNCRYLRRLKLLDCNLISDISIAAITVNCQNLMELDLQGCTLVQDESIAAAFNNLPVLREFKMGLNPNITDRAFESFPIDGSLQFDTLRILDLTGCVEITDATVLRLVSFSPKLRNLVLAKCSNITDSSLLHITKLGRSLHYLHLGHCSLITDTGVSQLVRHCTRIRYIDLACCMQLTNNAVNDLATLPKLRRVGLVKCQNITDLAIHALVQRRTVGLENSLERVHLSYCSNLTIPAIHDLLQNCPRLTHLSLTGVPAFMRSDLTQYCRAPPAEFNQHQQAVFCVFSGTGVARLRQHLAHLAREQQTMIIRAQQHAQLQAHLHQQQIHGGQQILPQQLLAPIFGGPIVGGMEMTDILGDDVLTADVPAVPIANQINLGSDQIEQEVTPVPGDDMDDMYEGNSE